MEYTMKVRTDDRLVMFIYSLIQRGVRVSQIEEAVDAARDILKPGASVELANGPLAVVAQEAARAIAETGCIKVDQLKGKVYSECETVFLKFNHMPMCSKCGTIFLKEKGPFENGIKPKSVLDIEAGKCPKCGEVWKKQGFGIDVPGSEKAV